MFFFFKNENNAAGADKICVFVGLAQRFQIGTKPLSSEGRSLVLIKHALKLHYKLPAPQIPPSTKTR